jgi:hypothetical protein
MCKAANAGRAGKFLVPLLLSVFICGFGQAVTAQGYDVEIRLNGGRNIVYIGDTNVVEVWIKNDQPLSGLSLGFEFSFDGDYQFDPACGTLGYANPEGDVVGTFTLFHTANVSVDGISPDTVMIAGVHLGIGDEFPAHPTHALCYTMKIYIPPSELPLSGGFCVDNIYWPPSYDWLMASLAGGGVVPDYQGHPNAGSRDPDAPPVCFDINYRHRCGDANGDGLTTVSDAVYLVNFIFRGGPPPASNCCD